MKKNEIFRCSHCGLVVEIRAEGATPVCCGEPMQKQEPKYNDTGAEKHLPVVEATANGTKVKVGSIPHPMTAEHYIQWIEIINGDYVNTKYLTPENSPEAEFYVPQTDKIKVRCYCNIHGLWEV